MNASQASQLAAHTGGAPFAIDVYCDDDSHREKPWDVSFIIDPRHQPPMWDVYQRSERWRRGHGQQPIRAHSDARVVLRGNYRLTDDEITADIFADPQVRIRYRLQCDLCGTSREFRGEKLHPVLDQMALGGARRIRMVRLAAMIGS